MKPPVDLSLLTPSERISGDCDEDTLLLKEMLMRAEDYLSSFTWCPPITEKYLGFAVGGVVALFLFRLKTPVNGTDEWLWVVEGDLPSAYFVVDQAANPASALEAYCELMEDWARAVLNKVSLDDVFPVKAEATQANAQALLSRTNFIRERILPEIE